MKKILSAVLLLTAGLAHAWDQRVPLPVQQCLVHNPYGFAQTVRTAQPICREAYFVAYDAPAKIPVYVSYTLLPQNALGCWPRTNAFVADKSVPNGATPSDYAGTGFDKGHAAPDGDMSWKRDCRVREFSYDKYVSSTREPKSWNLEVTRNINPRMGSTEEPKLYLYTLELYMALLTLQ